MKKILNLTKVFFLLSLLVIAFSAKAQRASVPAAYLPSYNKMMSNNAKMIQNQNARFAQNMLLSKYQYDPSMVENDEYIFSVALKNGSQRIINSRIYLDIAAHKTYLLLVNEDLPKKDPAREEKIYADKTLNISRTDEYNSEIKGNANDTCWQFKIISGKISAYSNLSNVTSEDSFYLSAFQVGDGPIVNLSPAALELIIKSDEKAYKAFNRKDYYKAIEIYNKHNR